MRGLAILVGDIGTGKTTLARKLLESLSDDEYEAGLLIIIHSGITPDWLLTRIAFQLGVKEPAKDKLAILHQLLQRLMEIYKNGKKSVVLIDEAQMLKTKEIMEEFRGLLNLEIPGRKLITFVFFGLPEIEENLKVDEPLAQRVALKYKLKPLSEDSTEAYIRHRLNVAGTKRMLFTKEAVKLIHKYSNGTPRLINTLCDNSLFEGYLIKEKIIDERVIRNVAWDIGLCDKKGEELPKESQLEPALGDMEDINSILDRLEEKKD
jgi:type II secretory pathway predicted ATPase ExeA